MPAPVDGERAHAVEGRGLPVDGAGGGPGGAPILDGGKGLRSAVRKAFRHRALVRRFSLRGLAKVRGEWDLVCLALNARRLHALMAA